MLLWKTQGGVGKSSVAVNLAYELAAQGGRIGLLDLDLFGPSLPLLVRPDDVTLRRSPLGPGAVYPIQHHNVKLLSLGYVNTHVSFIKKIQRKRWCTAAFFVGLTLIVLIFMSSEWRSRKRFEQWCHDNERTHGRQSCLAAVSRVAFLSFYCCFTQ